MKRARNGHLAHGAAALAELRLQVVERHFEFRECNYSLYPSWLAYPWPHAHLRISGGEPYALERRARQPSRTDDNAAAAPDGDCYVELADSGAVETALRDFAATAPRPAKALLNLNTGITTRSVSGQLLLFGRRIAALRNAGDLQTLTGIRFEPPLEVAAGRGRGARGRILIHPETRLEYAMPADLALRAQARPRNGLRVERVELLPSVFVDAGAFRSLWPQLPPAVTGERYRLLPQSGADAPAFRVEALDQPLLAAAPAATEPAAAV